MVEALVIIGYIVCSIITYETALAYFQRKYPLLMEDNYRKDAGMAALLALFGPVGLILSMFLFGFWKYGLMFRRKDR